MTRFEIACSNEVILALIELERRGLYRELGYRSLYEYCTRELKYSESGAMRRIHAARAIRTCPPALAYLRTGRVNLTTRSLSWKHLTPELLERISEKSRKEVEAIIAEFQPVPLTPDKTQTVVVAQVVRPPEAATLDGDSDECKDSYRRSGGKLFTSVENSTPPGGPGGGASQSPDARGALFDR